MIRTMMMLSMRVTAEERRRKLPGDALVPDPESMLMHAVTIDAPAGSIWPWLVQMGSGRAGWYSWDFVDNGGVRSSEVVIPGYQEAKPGDVFPSLPGEKTSFVVASVTAGTDLVLAVHGPDGGLIVSWEFFIDPVAKARSRLLVRGRVSGKWLSAIRDTSPLNRGPRPIERVYALLAMVPWGVMFPFAAFGHGIMQAKQLQGIKRRAERHWQLSGSS